MKPSHPPRFAVSLVDWLVPDECLTGDLLEEFALGRSRIWFWRQVLLAIAVSGLRDRREVRRFPLGIIDAPGREVEVRRMALPPSVNITGSPSPHVGGLGLVALVGLVTAVRPQAWWLVLLSLLVGAMMGVALVAVRRRRVLAAPGAAPAARLLT